MEWYGWVALAVGAVVALAAIGLRLLRASGRGRRFLGLPMRGKVRFGRLLLADPGVPFVAKVALVLLVGYLALPFDLIPDFIPVIGQLDDLLVVVLAVFALILLVPRELFEAALGRAEAEARQRLETARPAG
ncbi:MAG: YkvA family protein [Tepidiformaceae bacterium]